MFLSIVLISIFVCLVVAYLWTMNNSYNYFKRCGIPGPPYRFFFGHCKALWSAKSYSKLLQEWTRQYGSIYGIFQGTQPMYIVSDVDFLQEIYIKQFTSFNSRGIPKILRAQDEKNIHVFQAAGTKWRRQRNVINPIFSAAKLKLISPLMNECIETMLNKLSQIENSEIKEINIYELYQRMTMDILYRCAFGIDTDMQNDINNPFLQTSANLFKTKTDELLPVQLSTLMPFLTRPLRHIVFSMAAIRRILIKLIPYLIRYVQEFPTIWLMDRLQYILYVRTKTPSNSIERIDLLQLLIDTSTEDDIVDHADDHHISKLLRHDEIIPNAYIFMIAGYETTSAALASSTYILATQPEIQDKLVEEILRNNWNNNDSEEIYDIAINLPYLDMFVREVLRMYHLTTKGVSRQCNTTTTIRGHIIEEGSIIQPDVFSIHYNPELWGPEDPNLFIPERHAIKRHPVAWIPFGIGQRTCLGMRFALIELKMCLIQLLRQYRILPGDKIEQGFKQQERTIIQPEAIFVKLEKRIS